MGEVGVQSKPNKCFMNYNKLEIKQTNFQRNWKLELGKENTYVGGRLDIIIKYMNINK